MTGTRILAHYRHVDYIYIYICVCVCEVIDLCQSTTINLNAAGVASLFCPLGFEPICILLIIVVPEYFTIDKRLNQTDKETRE